MKTSRYVWFQNLTSILMIFQWKTFILNRRAPTLIRCIWRTRNLAACGKILRVLSNLQLNGILASIERGDKRLEAECRLEQRTKVALQTDVDGSFKLLAVVIVSGVQETDWSQKFNFVELPHLVSCPSSWVPGLLHVQNFTCSFKFFRLSHQASEVE